MAKLRIGTRGSNLAVKQTELVVAALLKIEPSIDLRLVKIKTKGDVENRPLFAMDEKGIFEKEIDQAVIHRDIDFAVHSLKDIPSELPEDLVIASIPKRAKPNDVLVNSHKLPLKDLPAGSIVGTSSLRRAIQVLRLRSDLDVRPIRGNVETRIKKTLNGEYDAIILAEAGLNRLSMQANISERFPIRSFVPAPGQGIMAVTCRSDNLSLISTLKRIEDHESRQQAMAERSLTQNIQGGCRFPVGAIATTKPNTNELSLHASVFSSDGSKNIRLKETGSIADAIKIGNKLAHRLNQMGVEKLATEWRNAIRHWNRRL
ncbi:MAG TPA: hydroxymethylbilane synthase [Nitrososphaeraceae archaeon]